MDRNSHPLASILHHPPIQLIEHALFIRFGLQIGKELSENIREFSGRSPRWRQLVVGECIKDVVANILSSVPIRSLHLDELLKNRQYYVVRVFPSKLLAVFSEACSNILDFFTDAEKFTKGN